MNRGGNKKSDGASGINHSNSVVSNHNSKIGSSGQMIIGGANKNMGQYSGGGDSHLNNNMNNQMGNPMTNPMYMMPYNPYGMGYNPYMMGMNAPNMMNPMMYNPYHMMGSPPINNYNRGMSYNSTNNQPVKLIGNNLNMGNYNNYNKDYETNATNNTNNLNILPEINSGNRDRMQRSKSSKYRSGGVRDNDDNSYSRNNSINNGPSTNPDSFSRKRGYSSSNDDGTYKPYTLKDYKELSAAKIVMGSLGPNIGTKEWEERQQKLKKMDEYASGLKQANKMVLKLNRETPQERIEREKREKMKNSTRHKSYEYAKLVKPKPKTSLTYEANYSGLGIINENEEDNKLQFMMDYHNKNTGGGENKYPDSNSNRRYISNAVNSNDSNFNNSEFKVNNNYQNNYGDIANMQKKREMYSLKINEIKESMLK